MTQTSGSLRQRLNNPTEPGLIFLAPMEGLVDAIVRDRLTRLAGVDACVTEFIRVVDRVLPDGVLFRDAPELEAAHRRLQTDGNVAARSQTPSGLPVLVQFLGGQPEPVAASAVRATELGAYGIDLNFGCPAKTVNRHDGGAALLKNPQRIHNMVKAVRAAVRADISVSAKIRLGFSETTQALEIALAAQEGGADWLTVHARTRDDGYRPPARWELLAPIREELKIPLIANGEIWSADDYHRCREITGCRHVMIGRGLIAQPDLAHQIRFAQTYFDWRRLQIELLEFSEQNLGYRGERYAVCRLKQMLRSLSRHWPEAHELFERIKTGEDLPSLQAALRV